MSLFWLSGFSAMPGAGLLPGMSEPWTAYSFLPARVRTARLVVTDERSAGHFFV